MLIQCPEEFFKKGTLKEPNMSVEWDRCLKSSGDMQ